MMKICIDDYLLEKYLDSEKEFFDYETSNVSTDNIVDVTKTGTGYYDDFLSADKNKHLQEESNLTGKIISMSPEEYYKKCAESIFECSVNELKSSRQADTGVIEKLKAVLLKYKRKLCIPVIDYAGKYQDGLHRMCAIGELYGWNFSVPVLVVDWYDKDLANNISNEEEQAKIDQENIEKAIDKSLKHSYKDINQFRDQLSAELSEVFKNDNRRKVPDHIELKETADDYSFTLFGYEYSIGKELVKVLLTDNRDLLDNVIKDTSLETNSQRSKHECINCPKFKFKLVESIDYSL